MAVLMMGMSTDLERSYVARNKVCGQEVAEEMNRNE